MEMETPLDERDAALNVISGDILDAAIRVHSSLGPGLLERVYARCLAHELRIRGRDVAEQSAVAVEYRGIVLEGAFRLDLLVDDEVVVEVKSVDSFHPVHEAQVLTYLRLTERRLGILINFNVRRVSQGFRRYLRDVPDDE